AIAAAAPAPLAPPIDDIVAENQLLGGALAALRTGDLTAATRLLDRHRTQFPTGKLTVARRAGQVRVACASGDVAGARASARRLLAEHPGDPDAVGVRDVCSAKK
ncbi:MAG: hypothetical protein IAG13_25590, partial [Deltaproteobacteria bacterium]|nr:hypothetical protein [Nannocystaceae bacterium]